MVFTQPAANTYIYTISGQYVGDDIGKISTPGLYISGGKKISIH